MEIIFIVVKPSIPENVGAIARAINTMGFNQLRLVNPCNHLDEKAMWLAHASQHILEKAKLFSSLKEALYDIDFVIGTTAKKRIVKNDYYNIAEIKPIVSNMNMRKLAVVFGREESGLTNAELSQCHLVSTIPMKNTYPSLNLAQAVMIYAYEMAQIQRQSTKSCEKPVFPKKLVLLKKMEQLLSLTDISENKNLSGRIFERVHSMNDKDSSLMLSVIQKIIERIKHPVKPDKKTSEK